MSYGQRINRLLFKIQQAERLDSLQLAVALIGKREETGKWEVYADLTDGKNGGKYERLTMVCDSREEAEKAVAEIESVHTPTGRKIKPSAGVLVVIDDISYSE